MAIIGVRRRQLSDLSAGLPQHDRGQVTCLYLGHPLETVRSVLIEVCFELCNVLRDPKDSVLVGHAFSLRVGRDGTEVLDPSPRVERDLTFFLSRHIPPVAESEGPGNARDEAIWCL